MRFLTRFALKNPVAVVILVLIVAVGGILSAFQLKEEFMPDISVPIISILTTYPGASPSQVATDVTEPIEQALNGAKDVETISSSSVANVSQIELQLNLSADLNSTEQNVSQILSRVNLPSTASKPSVQSFSFSNIPVLAFTVTDGKTGSALNHYVNSTLVPALQGVAGVAQVQTAGADASQVVITFNNTDLEKHGLSATQVLQQLQATNLSVPMGSLTVNGKVQPVQLNATFHSLADIRNTPIVVPQNANAAFASVGQAVGQLGSTVGQLGSAVGQLGSAVGQMGKGLQETGSGLAAVQMETRLLSSLQQIQGQIFGAELGLSQQLALPPARQNQASVQQLKAQIGALEKIQKQLTQQLAKIQSAMGATGASSTSSSRVASATSNPQAQTSLASTIPSIPAGKLAAQTSHGTQSNPSAQNREQNSVQTIPLSDVATVLIEPPTQSSINRTNGRQSVLLSVSKTENANTVDVANAVLTKIDSLQSGAPSGVKILTLFNSAQSVTDSVNGMLREAVLGAVFAVLVILIFLRNWKTTLIAIVSIPVSLLVSILLLNRLGITLNIMTLGGLAVATGRVVDDSIVVIENIYRTWRSGFGYGKKLVTYAVSEVGRAILASTLATIAVFVPLGMVSGMVGKIFYPFALTVVVSLASSFIVALTIVPCLAWLTVVRKPRGEAALTENVADVSDGYVTVADAEVVETTRANWQRRYRSALNFALNHKILMVLVTVVAFVASVAVLPIVGSTFIPNSAQPTVTVNVKYPAGTPLSTTNGKAEEIEALLRKNDAVQMVNTQVGSSGAFGYGTPKTNSASLSVELKNNTDVNTFASKLRAQLQPLSTGGAVLQVKEQSMGGATTSFDIVITGSNQADIKRAAQIVTRQVEREPGLANVENNLTNMQPEIQVSPKPVAAAKAGLTPAQISQVVRQNLSSQNIGTVNLDGQTYDFTAQVHYFGSSPTLAEVRNMKIPSQTGQSVTLGAVATVREISTPTSILHENGQAYAEITADYTTQNTGKVLRQSLKDIKKLNLPSDVSVGQSSAVAQQNHSFTQLIEAILVAVGVVYIVMLITFGEWSAPFAILFSMPVALIGAFFGTVIGRQPISVSSLIGILMLMGIVVTNAIVLVARVEQERERGMTVREALLEAGTTRLRPILMTAIATICALLPLAFGATEGALISQGLAVVVIGGLVTSTILTLCIVPLVYELLHFRVVRKERASAQA